MDKIICGDALIELKKLPENSVDAIVTDPPAGISFMGKSWDSDKGGKNEWIKWLSEVMKESLRVLKPGGHALVWALPRTSHWTGTALEDAGFEIRDCVYHLFGSGFPKSLDISKAIDKQAGVERKIIGKRNDGAGNKPNGNSFDDDNFEWKKEIEITEPSTPEAKQWEGWGTSLKPAVECWWLCRKPLSESTVAENVLKWGTGGLNIDGSRIGTEESTVREIKNVNREWGGLSKPFTGGSTTGRFPANLIHDGSDVILAEFPNSKAGTNKLEKGTGGIFNEGTNLPVGYEYGDEGSAARFFYCAKPSSTERNWMRGEFEERGKVFNGQSGKSSKDMKGVKEKFTTTPQMNSHPTVKSIALMSYLIKLITPPKGIVLDCFAGSGSTLVAAKQLDHPFIGIEIYPEYCKIIEGRLNAIPPKLF